MVEMDYTTTTEPEPVSMAQAKLQCRLDTTEVDITIQRSSNPGVDIFTAAGQRNHNGK